MAILCMQTRFESFLGELEKQRKAKMDEVCGCVGMVGYACVLTVLAFSLFAAE